MTSLASVKGPSVTVSCPLEIRTRVLCAVGARPPFPSIVPSLTASSAMMLIASMSSLGGGPEFSACLTNIMNFIVISPFDFWVVGWAFRTLRLPEPSLHLHVERGAVKSTSTTFILSINRVSLSITYDTLRLDCSCNSGNPAAASWTSAGKSDISCTWRSSITSLSEAGQRDAHSTASSLDLTWIIQYPPITSFASVKGPSVTFGLPPVNVTRAPIEGGWRPSSASSTPAFCRASLYFIMAATALASGIAPGWAFSYPLGIISIMNRIAVVSFWSSLVFDSERGFRTVSIGRTSALYSNVERGAGDRHVQYFFGKYLLSVGKGASIGSRA